MDDLYISKQIAVYKTDKKLIEFIDKLNPAGIETYAHIHGFGERKADGQKNYSNIGITIQDYSTGTGEQLKRAKVNISPDEAQFIFSRVFQCASSFEFHSEKIFGEPDEHGRSIVTKLRLLRADTDSKGKPRNYPWYIEIDNGTGLPGEGKNGGTYIKSGSFVSKVKVFVNINDLDFFKLMNRVNQFITGWENAHAPKLIRMGREAFCR